MKRYILGRLFRATISLIIVVSIAITLVFFAIPRDKVFEKDPNVTKLSGNKDKLAVYKLQRLQELGYLEYYSQKDIVEIHDLSKKDRKKGSKALKKLMKAYEDSGFTVKKNKRGLYYVYRDYKPLEMLGRFYSNLIVLDTTNTIQDPNNPDLERKLYFTTDFNGRPCIKGSGTKHRYMLYFNGSFPWIHQNFISLNFGMSHPTFAGHETLDVISNGQGRLESRESLFENGEVINSPLNLYTAKYKDTDKLDNLDKKKFTSNYVDCDNYYDSPSMISMSYIFSGLAVLIAYFIAIPFGIAMARKKGQFVDKLGIVYINIMIAMPSLAFIFFMKSIGRWFDLPDKFSQLGFGDIRSYIMPIIILTLLSTSGILMWMRRYMIDQSNADYVKFARAKGLSQKEIFGTHILRNAIIPITNSIPRSIILAIGGAVMTETIFAIPGMGKMLPDAINVGNNNMIITLTFIFTALSVFALLLGDILMSIVDPRIKLSAKGGTR